MHKNEGPIQAPYARHIFLCTGPYCDPDGKARRLYGLLSQKLGELGEYDNPVRVKRGVTPCLGVCYGGPVQPVCGARGHPCGARLSACCGSMLCRLQDDGSEICTADIPRRGLNASQGIAVRNPRRLPALLPVLQRTTLPGYTDSPGR